MNGATIDKYIELPSVNQQLEQLQQITHLMQFQMRMPVNQFQTKEEAYESAGCDHRAPAYLF